MRSILLFESLEKGVQNKSAESSAADIEASQAPSDSSWKYVHIPI
jgi:hypothetical protein